MVRIYQPEFSLISIYVAMMLLGVIRSFYSPTNVALSVASVPRMRLPESAAWNGSLWHIAFFGGSFLGGVINGFFDSTAAYAFATGLVCIALLFNSALERDLGKVVSKKYSLHNHLHGLIESFQFLKKEKVLLASFSVDMMVVFFAGAIALLPIFADEILGVGAQGLGFLRAAPGMGALCISLFLARNPSFLDHHTGRALIISMSLFGISMFLFAFSTSFYLSMLLLFFGGLFDGVSVVIRSSLLQIVSPEAMRGRLAAINSIFVSSSNELGALESGITAEFFGTVPSVVIGSLLTQIILIIVVFFVPDLKKMNYNSLLRQHQKRSS